MKTTKTNDNRRPRLNRRRLARTRGTALAMMAVPAVVAVSAVVVIAAVVLGSWTGADGVRIVSYNVQNLFDDSDDGGEYAEFTSGGGWTRKAYFDRLDRLDRVIRAVGGPLAHVIALQEVENAGVARTLAADLLPGRWSLCSGSSAAGGIQVVLLSRLELDSCRAHRAVDVDVVADGAYRTRWSGRDTLEASLLDSRLVVFAAHWKSQSGGERETEHLRRLDAALLVTRADGLRRSSSSSGLPPDALLLVGDLNQDIDEFEQHGGAYPTALRGADAAPADAVAPPRPAGPGGSLVFDRTLDDAGDGWVTLWTGVETPGTYFFRGAWERLDHAFLAVARSDGGVHATMRVVTDERLLTESRTPRRYDARSGHGYSDHLPIVIDLSIPPAR